MANWVQAWGVYATARDYCISYFVVQNLFLMIVNSLANYGFEPCCEVVRLDTAPSH